jgi:diguanylate cyclase (GGDEF)-like protein/PAS domain S-box-containing protein
MGTKSIDLVEGLTILTDIFESNVEINKKIEEAFFYACQLIDADLIFLRIYNASVTHYRVLYHYAKDYANGILSSTIHPASSIIRENMMVQGHHISDGEGNDRPTIFYPLKINNVIIGSVGIHLAHKRKCYDPTIHAILKHMSHKISLLTVRDYEAIKYEINSFVYKQLFECHHDSIIFINADYKIIDVNQAFLELFDVLSYEIIFKDFFTIIDSYENKKIKACIEECSCKDACELEIFKVIKGEKKILSLKILKLTEENLFSIIIRDVTKEKIEIRKLRKMAYYDLLTGLHNRNYYEQVCDDLIINKQPFGVLLIDIDNLKHINDHHGHEVGDEMIHTLSYLIVDVFSSEYLTARIGGDEFIVFFNNQTEDYIGHKKQEFLEKLRLLNQEARYATEISCGIAYSEEMKNIHDLIREADRAMYQDKQAK